MTHDASVRSWLAGYELAWRSPGTGVMRFGPDGRCAGFEEWPFWPPGTPGVVAGHGG